jgi:hypothetical protein
MAGKKKRPQGECAPVAVSIYDLRAPSKTLLMPAQMPNVFFKRLAIYAEINRIAGDRAYDRLSSWKCLTLRESVIKANVSLAVTGRRLARQQCRCR